ncbi:non-specific lipid-transfer protein 1-like [Vicia villosa]|uniref:non-specific lipid-transfer protein 1-like n=1 Tax=Vicia villosa TaxID=3911 RepID=UPI00273A85E4|nr:non-specific lipid-transfer protein 1-like [Vicia villosa]XP_058739832.1 non-specific lipid-transfer protein 1-like [Vicia villosa]XP_058752603.1 non-specific lipid-transfer protein 1-like [Vicia villosa]
MASSILIKIICLAIICLVLDIPLANAGQTCGQIKVSLIPCLGYLKHPGPTIPVVCCNGVRTVNDQAKTLPERKDACECIKSTLISIPVLDPNAVQGLPDKCGVKLPFPIGVNMDCSKLGGGAH